MSEPDPDLLAILYSALRSSIGVMVATDNVERLRNKLYAARSKAEDPDLEILMLAPDPKRPTTHLLVAKKRIIVEGETNAETG